MNQKNIVIIPALLLVTFLAFPGGFVRAQDGVEATAETNANVEVHPPKPEVRKDIIEKKKEVRDEIKDKRLEVKADIKDKRADLKEDIKDKKDELKDAAKDMRDRMKKQMSERIKKELDQMTKRFTAAIERLEKLAGRIDSRITKIKAAGKDTTEAEKFLSDARVKINQAKIDAAKVPGLIEQISQNTASSTASTTPIKGQFTEVKKLVQTIQKELQDARVLLSKAIGKIRGLHIGEETHATSTATTTTTTSTATTTTQ